jgi:hypothetical protein
MIVLEIGRETQRDCEQTTTLRREIVARGVRASDDRGQMIERRLFDVENPQVVSNEQRSPSCVNSTPLTSYGVAPVSLAVSRTWSGGT